VPGGGVGVGVGGGGGGGADSGAPVTATNSSRMAGVAAARRSAHRSPAVST